MAEKAEFASAEAVERGGVVFGYGAGSRSKDLLFEDPAKALDAARALESAAQQAMTERASAIAEEKALVGSSSHHMDRGAASHFHYDRRAAPVEGPPLQAHIPEQRAAAPEFEPGQSPVTGTSQASVDATERMVASGGGAGAIGLQPLGEGKDAGAGGGPPATVSPEPPGDPSYVPAEGAAPVEGLPGDQEKKSSKSSKSSSKKSSSKGSKSRSKKK